MIIPPPLGLHESFTKLKITLTAHNSPYWVVRKLMSFFSYFSRFIYTERQWKGKNQKSNIRFVLTFRQISARSKTKNRVFSERLIKEELPLECLIRAHFQSLYHFLVEFDISKLNWTFLYQSGHFLNQIRTFPVNLDPLLSRPKNFENKQNVFRIEMNSLQV